jgi:hypothetical protein
MADFRPFYADRFVDLHDVLRDKVGQAVGLDVAPHVLRRVQFRRVRREAVQMQTREIRLHRLNRGAFVHHAPVVHQDQRRTDLPQQVPQKVGVEFVVHVLVGLGLIVEADVPADRRERQNGGDRDLVAVRRQAFDSGICAPALPSATSGSGRITPAANSPPCTWHGATVDAGTVTIQSSVSHRNTV